MRALLIASLFGLSLAGCSTTTPYAPADGDGYGYADQKIEDDRYRIVFRGNSLTDRETVETYLLYRAAELTLDAGYDHFIVVEDDTEKKTTYSGQRDYGPLAYYGYGRPFPYYGYGYRWAPLADDFTVTERNRYTAIAYIKLGRGAKPETLPTAYDARQVKENLGAKIVRPTAS